MTKHLFEPLFELTLLQFFYVLIFFLLNFLTCFLTVLRQIVKQYFNCFPLFQNDDFGLKICDFGLAQELGEGELRLR
jgi:hypothetical protein